MNRESTFARAALVVLTMYFVCSVCPYRLVPSLAALQRFAVSDTHDDCDKAEHQKSAFLCQELSGEYLPSRTAEIYSDLRSHAVLLPLRGVAFAVNFPFRLISTKPPGSDPPLGLLYTKLRI